MTIYGGLYPEVFYWTVRGKRFDFPASEIVYFNGYSPMRAISGFSPLAGLSPLETLRPILAEEEAATMHRSAVLAERLTARWHHRTPEGCAAVDPRTEGAMARSMAARVRGCGCAPWGGGGA